MNKMYEQKNKIYVGNLEFSVSEEELKKTFEDKGVQVRTVNIIKDKYTGRARGFGFIEVDSEGEIQKAIEALHGQELNGRRLTVNKARKPKTDRMGGERSSSKW
jgi:RNA recognition motif-containing protein